MDGKVHVGNNFEDCQVGDEYVTTGRTITTTDVEIYTNYMEDYNPLYTDEEFAKTEVYATRIVPELLIYAISIGQMSRMRLFEGTMLGFDKIDIDFIKPSKTGDTITIKGKLIEKKETDKKEQGIVNFNVEVLNQRGEILARSKQWILVRKKTD
jgi:acyl dehydratase